MRYNTTLKCSVARTINLLGERWIFLILGEAYFGICRFDQFQKNLGIARNILTNRLNYLVQNGIIKKQKYTDPPYRFEYKLTEMGLQLFPIILTMIAWGDKWIAGPEGPPLLLYHQVCGQLIKPVVVCSNCDKEIKVSDISYNQKVVSCSDFDNVSYTMRKFGQKSNASCSVERFVNLYGDHWTFLIIRAAFFRVRRFDQFLKEVGIPRSSLTYRLRALVNNGIFEKKLYCHHPRRYEYRLTQKGKDMYPLILTTLRWGDRWLAGKEGPPLQLIHKPCGQIIEPLTICDHCRHEIKAWETSYINGTGASENRSSG
ncbi:MAG: helix-turn-helix domain-containing protein [Dehalococcoidia bacterium]|nr:helix-turn-helix domain-containing protein [Dehalococcoidia bacterium]